MDSRKRVAGSDSDFEVDLGESLHLQSNARLAVCPRTGAATSVGAALGTLNWALLPEGAYTGPRLAVCISSNFGTATYSETTNSLSVAYDGNRLILNDLELRQQFPDAAARLSHQVDHMLGPSSAGSRSLSS